MRTLRGAILSLVLTVCALLLSSCNRREEGLAPGKVAPSFAVERIDAPGELTLAEFRGRVVVLNFWATWCGPCVDELPALERLAESVRGEGIDVVAVAIDDTAGNLKSFLASVPLTIPVGLDARGRVKGAYRLGGVPETFLIDGEGKIAMLIDPESRVPVARIVGPRDWNSPAMRRELLALTKSSR